MRKAYLDRRLKLAQLNAPDRPGVEGAERTFIGKGRAHRDEPSAPVPGSQG